MNFYRVGKPSTYYWEFLSQWGKECYSSWRREIFIAVVLSFLIYLVSWREKGAWESTKDTLEGNLLLFLIFVVIHLARVPYLLHRDRMHPIEGGTPYIRRGFGIFGIALAIIVLSSAAYGIVELWLGKAPIIAMTICAPPPPIASNPIPPTKERDTTPSSKSAGQPARSAIPPNTSAPVVVTQAPVQSSQAAQPQAPATFLDRVVQENRGLTPDDRNRLSTELYECDQFIKQSQTVGYKLNSEFGKLTNDRQSGALAKNVEDHIKFLRDLDTPAWDQYHGLQKFQDKWQYFPDQTEYVFGDNPFNAGVGLLVNATEGIANMLTSWSKISNRDQQDILNLEAQQQTDFEANLRHFFDWANVSLQRIKQMRQSLDPNGVVQPLPTGVVAPAAGMFTMKLD
jgi:hypothetical protein